MSVQVIYLVSALATYRVALPIFVAESCFLPVAFAATSPSRLSRSDPSRFCLSVNLQNKCVSNARCAVWMVQKLGTIMTAVPCCRWFPLETPKNTLGELAHLPKPVVVSLCGGSFGGSFGGNLAAKVGATIVEPLHAT